MTLMYWIAILIALYLDGSAFAQLTNDTEQLLNWCIKAENHKDKPGKEATLYEQCIPWKDKACCKEETTKDIHHTDMYNFNLNHCFHETGRNMSDNCRRHFNQDHCFYECEPHIGLWVVKTSRRIAEERFHKVPLCASDCDSWWNACKDDFTCAFNWPKNFNFSKGVNYCPNNAKCQTFESVYKNAKTFCENVWDHSWEYVQDRWPCMRIWFDGSAGNPNEKVAEIYIKKRFEKSASSFSLNSGLHLFLVILYFVLS